MILFTNRNYADGQLDQVAADFDLNPKELRDAIKVVGNIGGISRPARARMWIGENP